jgi:hypothetical protein
LKLRRRGFLHLAEGAAVLPAASEFAAAENHPARLVRIVVGLAAPPTSANIRPE